MKRLVALLLAAVVAVGSAGILLRRTLAEWVEVPILYYHSISWEEGDYVTSPAVLEEHLAALKAAGYTAISFDQLEGYVLRGEPLPEKPILITFDDGYENNYTLAYPLFAAYEMQANFFVIGRSLGWDTYVDGKPMTPHFSLEQAAEMESSGWVHIYSHGYNLHQVAGRDPEPVRKDAAPLPGESREAYAAFLAEDFAAMEMRLGEAARIVAYPRGVWTKESEELLSRLGVTVTVTTEPGINRVIRGDPGSLRLLNRLSGETLSTGKALLTALERL